MTAPIEVPLSRGKVALVSPEDAPRVLAHKWSYHTGTKGKGYACRNLRVVLANGAIKQRTMLLHRFVIDAAPDVEIDHVDGDGLNCQRHNLRVATRAQNVANTGPRRNGRMAYKGVYFRSDRNRYRAEITIDGKRRDLGTYPTAAQAAVAYDAAAYAAWGEFAYMNFEHLRDLYALCVTSARVPKRITTST